MSEKKRTGRKTEAVLLYEPHWFSPEDWMTFLELRPFSRRWDSLGLDDQDLLCLQACIMAGPKNAPVIEGTGSLRKIRWVRKDAAKGKSGGYRVCYVYFEEFGVIVLVLIYEKKERDNINDSQKAAIKKVIQRIEKEFSSRPYRAGPREKA